MLTVGEILKNEREKKGYSLLHVARKIRVREKFLAALEKNDWDIFTSKIYIEGLIRNYTLFLGLDTTKALAFFRRDYEKKDEAAFRKAVSNKHLIPESKKYATMGLVVLVACFIAYFAYQLKLYLSPPKIELLAPKEASFKRIDKIRIVGKTEREAVVTIFKDRIFQNKEGVFVYDLPLHKGKNTLFVEATGANGKKTTLRREFFLTP